MQILPTILTIISRLPRQRRLKILGAKVALLRLDPVELDEVTAFLKRLRRRRGRAA